MNKYLGIDFGLRWIGIAVSEGLLAEPYKQVENTSRAIDEIATMVDLLGVEKIVLGLSEGKMKELTRKFAIELGEKAKKEILFADETWSTKEAATKVAHKGVEKRKSVEHAVAAALILQDWIDANT